MFWFWFWLDDTIFNNLTKNALKFFKLKKKFKIIFFTALCIIFLTKNNYNFSFINDLFAQITFPYLL